MQIRTVLCDSGKNRLQIPRIPILVILKTLKTMVIEGKQF
jgi:hypothetical protein